MSKRPDLHSDAGVATYSVAMDKSAEDKFRALSKYLRAGSTLEIGCGSGGLLEMLASVSDGKTVGVDLSGRLLAIASQRDYGDKDVSLFRRDAWLMDSSSGIPHGFFDNLVLCSFLHEIYSAKLDEGERSDFGSGLAERNTLRMACSLARTYLKPGGVLLIRDGFRYPHSQVRVRFKTEFARERFFMFADDFAQGLFEMEFDTRDHSAIVDLTMFYEFATKYFYVDNWAVEVGETFGWTTVDSMRDLSEYGLRVLEASTYCIPFLRDKWIADFEVRDAETGEVILLDSTMVVAAELLGGQ